MPSTLATKCDARIRSLEFYLPGDPVSLAEIDMSDDMRAKLPGIGQEFTFMSDDNSTEMSILAARQALDKAGIDAKDIGLIISAPTLSTSYGFEIPAIAIRAALGLQNAECLNVAQGCVGFLAAMRLAAQYLATNQGRGDVLVVTACKASTLMKNFTHGAFFWADAAAAAVLTTSPDAGLRVVAYGEKNSDQDWGAMRLRHGDDVPHGQCDPADDLKVVVDFADDRAQMDYIVGEQSRCGGLIDALLVAGNLELDALEGLFLPSIGANRVPHLLGKHKELREKVRSDFRFAHMGGVDVMFFLDQHLKAKPPQQGEWYMVMTPAFTAQWGGLLLRYDGVADEASSGKQR